MHACMLAANQQGSLRCYQTARCCLTTTRKLVGLSGYSCVARHHRRIRALAAGSDSTLKSLDQILGSKESLDEGDVSDGGRPTTQSDSVAAQPKRVDARRQFVEAGPKRVRPLYVYVIYYCYLVVYLTAAWLQATEGDLASSALLDALSNDHLAVASGQVPRLATYAFVCDGPFPLFLQLATLATVGAEAEALLGYGPFWAVHWMALLGGGLADAALSELPVTAGPANGAAGVVGALAAYYVRNWGLEEATEAAREAARERRRRALAGGEGAEEQGLPPGRESLQESETEVEVLPLLLSLKFNTRLSGQARGLLQVLVALVVAGQGLLELGDASGSASWIGLAASAWTGAVLTFGAGPQYEVRLAAPAATAPSSRDGAAAVAPPGAAPASPGAGGGTAAGGAPRADESEPAGDSDGLVVVDVCPPARRRTVLAGYTAALAGLIAGWLAWMGTDI